MAVTSYFLSTQRTAAVIGLDSCQLQLSPIVTRFHRKKVSKNDGLGRLEVLPTLQPIDWLMEKKGGGLGYTCSFHHSSTVSAVTEMTLEAI